MEPIRILQENVIMDPGGIESLLMNLYRHIDRNLIQFDFLLHRPQEGKFDKEIQSLGGKIYRTVPFNPFHHQAYMNSMRQIIRSHPEYKIIHAHSELNYWPLKVAKQENVPVRIAHSHNARSTMNLKYFFLTYEKAVTKSVATNLFMCSTIAGEWSYGKQAVSDGKCIFLKNGIETDKYAYDEQLRKKLRKEMGLENKFVIGHVGRFMRQKNHSFLIDIFSALVKINPDARLLLISEGRLLDDIKKKVKDMQIDDKVLFLGFRDDVNDLMQVMDIFVLPSLWEGLPFTLIEAQSAGLPCIISDVISDEAIVSDIIKKVSLKESASNWAKQIIDMKNRIKRKDISSVVKAAGFDIVTSAKLLQEFYLKKYEEVSKDE